MYIYQIPYKLDYKIDDDISIEIYSDDEFYINVGGECIIFPVDKLEDLKNIISDALTIFENKKE